MTVLFPDSGLDSGQTFTNPSTNERFVWNGTAWEQDHLINRYGDSALGSLYYVDNTIAMNNLRADSDEPDLPYYLQPQVEVKLTTSNTPKDWDLLTEPATLTNSNILTVCYTPGSRKFHAFGRNGVWLRTLEPAEGDAPDALEWEDLSSSAPGVSLGIDEGMFDYSIYIRGRFFVAGRKGLYVSDDNGDTWVRVIEFEEDRGAPNSGIDFWPNCNSCTLIKGPEDQPETMFIAVGSKGAEWNDGHLYKSTDNGDTWTLVYSSIYLAGSIAWSEKEQRYIIAGGSKYLFWSDGPDGTNWNSKMAGNHPSKGRPNIVRDEAGGYFVAYGDLSYMYQSRSGNQTGDWSYKQKQLFYGGKYGTSITSAGLGPHVSTVKWLAEMWCAVGGAPMSAAGVAFSGGAANYGNWIDTHRFQDDTGIGYPIGNNVYDICHGGDSGQTMFLMCGNEGRIWKCDWVDAGWVPPVDSVEEVPNLPPGDPSDLYFNEEPVFVRSDDTVNSLASIGRSIERLKDAMGSSKFYQTDTPDGADRGDLWLNPSNSKISIYLDSDSGWNQLN